MKKQKLHWEITMLVPVRNTNQRLMPKLLFWSRWDLMMPQHWSKAPNTAANIVILLCFLLDTSVLTKKPKIVNAYPGFAATWKLKQTNKSM